MRIHVKKIDLLIFFQIFLIIIFLRFMGHFFLPVDQIYRVYPSLFFDKFQNEISKIKKGTKRAEVEKILAQAEPSAFAKIFAASFFGGRVMMGPTDNLGPVDFSGPDYGNCPLFKECSYSVSYKKDMSWNLFLGIMDVIVLYKDAGGFTKCKPLEFRDMGKKPFDTKLGSSSDDEVVGLFIYDHGKNKLRECSKTIGEGGSYEFKEIICGEKNETPAE